MFGWFKPKPTSKAPVYLGDLAVAPRSDVFRFFEWDWNGVESDVELRNWISQALELPVASEQDAVEPNSFVVDVVLSNYRRGAFDLSEALPIFWRPFVEVKVRLRTKGGSKVVGSHTAKKKMPWRQFLNRFASLRGYFFPRKSDEDNDMRYLILSGLTECLQWAQKRAYT